jgi:leader peptidase (prepilin peptidase)/N-methyltransferase
MSWFIYATAILIGLLIGSFLNVVIHRGPALWGLIGNERRARGSFVSPRSYCPGCKSRIAIIDLIPVVSYLMLRGKCRSCGKPISARYPAVELAGATAAFLSIAVFGLTWSALFAAILLFAMIALAAIDLETGYLPDALTLPLIGLGLIVNVRGQFVSFSDSAIGAATGYLAFAAIIWLYRRLRSREGLGGGDAKLLAALGAWGGWALLPLSVFIGACLALVFLAGARLAGRPLNPETPIPFGPALCLGGAVAFFAEALRMWPFSP